MPSERIRSAIQNARELLARLRPLVDSEAKARIDELLPLLSGSADQHCLRAAAEALGDLAVEDPETRTAVFNLYFELSDILRTHRVRAANGSDHEG